MHPHTAYPIEHPNKLIPTQQRGRREAETQSAEQHDSWEESALLSLNIHPMASLTARPPRVHSRGVSLSAAALQRETSRPRTTDAYKVKLVCPYYVLSTAP